MYELCEIKSRMNIYELHEIKLCMKNSRFTVLRCPCATAESVVYRDGGNFSLSQMLHFPYFFPALRVGGPCKEVNVKFRQSDEIASLN